MACATTLPAAQSAEGLKPRVAIAGRSIPETGGLWLEVEYEAGAAGGAFDALLVYSKPSSTLLHLHYDRARLSSSALAIEDHLSTALSTATGSMRAFSHSIALIENPLAEGDDRIAVVMMRKGNAFLVSDAAVNSEQFNFSTRFPIIDGDKTISTGEFTGNCGIGEWEHCCGGPRCIFGCICCDGPSFCCNLITCALECGDGEC